MDEGDGWEVGEEKLCLACKINKIFNKKILLIDPVVVPRSTEECVPKLPLNA